jgi:hypothetical protein
MRDLEDGDMLYRGETLVSGDSAQVSLLRPDGSTMVIGESSFLPMSDELAAFYHEDTLDGGTTYASAAAAGDSENQELRGLLDALSGDGDINAAMEATASGGPRASGTDAQDAAPLAVEASIGSYVLTVSSVVGSVQARTADGHRRDLHEGDVIYQGEILVIGDDSSATLQLPAGGTMEVGESRTLPMTDELATYYYEDALSGSTSFANATGTASGESSDIGKLLDVLSGDGDVNTVLEATAAGRPTNDD